MSNFLTRIKGLLNDHRGSFIRDGGKAKILVPVADLEELLWYYEAEDSDTRFLTGIRDPHTSLQKSLNDCVIALWHNNDRNGEEVNYIVSKALIPLIEEREQKVWTTRQMGIARSGGRNV
jgi:hypothetical protein